LAHQKTISTYKLIKLWKIIKQSRYFCEGGKENPNDIRNGKYFITKYLKQITAELEEQQRRKIE